MTNCQKCETLTGYTLGSIPLCFSCICEIEKNSEALAVIKRCELITGVNYSTMQLKTTDRGIIRAKRYTMKILKDEKVGNLSFIGDLFNMDYSSVSLGIKKINELIESKQLRY